MALLMEWVPTDCAVSSQLWEGRANFIGQPARHLGSLPMQHFFADLAGGTQEAALRVRLSKRVAHRQQHNFRRRGQQGCPCWHGNKVRSMQES